MKKLNPDIVIALVLLVLSGIFFVETFFYKSMPGAIIGAKIWPRIVTVLLGVLAFIFLVQNLRAPAKVAGPDDTPWQLGPWLAENRNVIALFVLYGLFLLSLKWLGMLLGGILFVFVTLTFLGERSMRDHAINAAVAIITIGSMWAIFTFLLGVILPQGEILPR